MRLGSLSLALAATLVVAGGASAQYTSFSDQGAFLAALGAGSYTTEGFEGFSTSATAPFSFSYGSGQTASLSHGEIIDDSQPSDKDPVAGNRAYAIYPDGMGAGPYDLTFSSLVHGFGLYMEDLDGGGVTMSFFRAGVLQFSYGIGSQGNGSIDYRGFVADAGHDFDQVRFTQAGSEWITYDDMTVAAAKTTTTTPEPVSMALLGTGLMGVLGAARRRRKSDAAA